MKLIIFITIFSLGLNSNIPSFQASEKFGSLAFSVKKCPFAQDTSGSGSPFSCPKNSKKGDCPKKFVNRTIPTNEESFTTTIEFVAYIPPFDQIMDYSNYHSFAHCVKPEKPDPPGNPLLLI
ncbi:MAG: hypothetical protein H8E85_02880 [Candidatus Marinimicrobia bacterium]|nr:hypothetical protein [Candidatus Neomarinimicrobiota bacterium]